MTRDAISWTDIVVGSDSEYACRENSNVSRAVADPRSYAARTASTVRQAGRGAQKVYRADQHGH
jgi:hypothetical protein